MAGTALLGLTAIDCPCRDPSGSVWAAHGPTASQLPSSPGGREGGTLLSWGSGGSAGWQGAIYKPGPAQGHASMTRAQVYRLRVGENQGVWASSLPAPTWPCPCPCMPAVCVHSSDSETPGSPTTSRDPREHRLPLSVLEGPRTGPHCPQCPCCLLSSFPSQLKPSRRTPAWSHCTGQSSAGRGEGWKPGSTAGGRGLASPTRLRAACSW